ncbi:492_t:CDS:2, partial [Gigaspora rosea]
LLEVMTRSATREELKALLKENNLIKINFYHLFIDQFASEAQQHQWQMELYELQQKDTEKVDVNATKFQKLLSQINIDNGFSKGLIIRMFLKGLKGNNAEL